MANIKITETGKKLIAQADKQRGIYPNHIYLLSNIRNGNWFNESVVKAQLGLADWDDVLNFLHRNKAIEKHPF